MLQGQWVAWCHFVFVACRQIWNFIWGNFAREGQEFYWHSWGKFSGRGELFDSFHRSGISKQERHWDNSHGGFLCAMWLNSSLNWFFLLQSSHCAKGEGKYEATAGWERTTGELHSLKGNHVILPLKITTEFVIGIKDTWVVNKKSWIPYYLKPIS